MRFATRLSVRPTSRLPSVAPSGVRGINSYANFKIPTINNEPNVCCLVKDLIVLLHANHNVLSLYIETLHPWISGPQRTGRSTRSGETVQHSKHPINDWRKRGMKNGLFQTNRSLCGILTWVLDYNNQSFRTIEPGNPQAGRLLLRSIQAQCRSCH
jgi:hypothetical protein